jgi:hypothetical protein
MQTKEEEWLNEQVLEQGLAVSSPVPIIIHTILSYIIPVTDAASSVMSRPSAIHSATVLYVCSLKHSLAQKR